MAGLTPAELRDLTLSVGTHRATRRLSPLEVAQLIGKMLRFDSNREKCSQHLGISKTQISSFLRLLDVDARVQHLADWRGTANATIPFSTLSETARLEPTEQVVLAEAALRTALGWKEVVQIVQIRERSGEPIDACIERILALRPEIVKQHVFVGRVGQDSGHMYLQGELQSARDDRLERALNRVLGSNYPRKSRLGENTFTIISDHDLPRLLDITPDELEIAVNRMLRELTDS